MMAPNERSSLLRRSAEAGEHRDADDHENTRSVVSTVCATFLGMERIILEQSSIVTVNIGEFLASADDSLMTSTYSGIASEFLSLSQGSWLLVSYKFGYCVAAPVVSRLRMAEKENPVMTKLVRSAW
jgi:hypothetical protein